MSMSARRARTPSSLTLQGGETQSADECFEAVGWLSRPVVVLMDERTVDVEVDVHCSHCLVVVGSSALFRAAAFSWVRQKRCMSA